MNKKLWALIIFTIMLLTGCESAYFPTSHTAVLNTQYYTPAAPIYGSSVISYYSNTPVYFSPYKYSYYHNNCYKYTPYRCAPNNYSYHPRYCIPNNFPRNLNSPIHVHRYR